MEHNKWDTLGNWYCGWIVQGYCNLRSVYLVGAFALKEKDKKDNFRDFTCNKFNRQKKGNPNRTASNLFLNFIVFFWVPNRKSSLFKLFRKCVIPHIKCLVNQVHITRKTPIHIEFNLNQMDFTICNQSPTWLRHQYKQILNIQCTQPVRHTVHTCQRSHRLEMPFR